MDRQRLLDTFLDLVDGKGPATGPGAACYYFRDVHPGCAIGCQPGFRDVAPDAWGPITHVIQAYPDVRDLFSIKDESDIRFLSALQDLHDRRYNWTKEGYLTPDKIQAFAENWDLESPVQNH